MAPHPEPGATTTQTGPAAALRGLLDKGSITRLMVLRALARDDARTLRRVADEIGVTVQAVSEHLKRLVAAGLVADAQDGPRLTREGHEALAAQLGTLKRYVDGAVRDLARIETTAARAGAALRQGDEVGLFMEDGELIARPRAPSPSKGSALQDAKKDQDVLVGSLHGIVALNPGTVTFLILPDAEEGGTRSIDPAIVKHHVRQAGLVAVQGPVARHAAEAAGAQPVRFAPAAVAAEAALVGVEVVILAEASRMAELKERFQRACEEWGFTPRTEDVTAVE